jgi:ribosomal protein L11 methylase PrmA
VERGRVLRAMTGSASEDHQAARYLLDPLEKAGRIVKSSPVVAPDLGAHVVEHPKLPIITYPYEWCFDALRDAALLHLDLQLDLLEGGFALTDASAFNVQFVGHQPMFIDVTSIRRYVDGEYWGGYRQFCEQFLYPLLLTSHCGVPFQSWYRGRLSGIDGRDLARLLPTSSWFSLRAVLHVHLHSILEDRLRRRAPGVQRTPQKAMPRSGYLGLLQGLRRWIKNIRDPNTQGTVWSDYEGDNSYQAEETQSKSRFISTFISETKPKIAVDLGCNSGLFSEVALKAGADLVIGLEGDHGAISRAFARAKERSLRFQPLLVDLANLAPDQGWSGTERMSLHRRLKADALIALAVVHHLTFGSSIPLPVVLKWILSLAPAGVIEFVPPNDPMVLALSAHRETGHLSYNRDEFVRALEGNATILRSEVISKTGRELFQFELKKPSR